MYSRTMRLSTGSRTSPVALFRYPFCGWCFLDSLRLEHLLVMPVPVALKHFIRVVL